MIIPPAVLEELRHSRAPRAVAEWIGNLPTWVRVQAPHSQLPNLGLDPGETEAISLAVELHLPAILIDERAGRLVAEERGLIALGTLNVLYSAFLHGFLDFEFAIERLRRTNFHVDSATVDALLSEAQNRKRK